MTATRKQPMRKPLIRGTATHRRTERDYMGALLDAVTLEDWREVVAATLQRAKAGDDKARAWLAQYLIGRPETKAPSPLTVVVQQLGGVDVLAERLAHDYMLRELDPADTLEERAKAELAALLPHDKTTSCAHGSAGLCGGENL